MWPFWLHIQVWPWYVINVSPICIYFKPAWWLGLTYHMENDMIPIKATSFSSSICRGHHSRSSCTTYWFGIGFRSDALLDKTLSIYLGLGPALLEAGAMGVMWGSEFCQGHFGLSWRLPGWKASSINQLARLIKSSISVFSHSKHENYPLTVSSKNQTIRKQKSKHYSLQCAV